MVWKNWCKRTKTVVHRCFRETVLSLAFCRALNREIMKGIKTFVLYLPKKLARKLDHFPTTLDHNERSSGSVGRLRSSVCNGKSGRCFCTARTSRYREGIRGDECCDASHFYSGRRGWSVQIHFQVEEKFYLVFMNAVKMQNSLSKTAVINLKIYILVLG